MADIVRKHRLLNCPFCKEPLFIFEGQHDPITISCPHCGVSIKFQCSNKGKVMLSLIDEDENVDTRERNQR